MCAANYERVTLSQVAGFAKIRAVLPLMITPLLALHLTAHDTIQIGIKNYTEVAFTCGIAVISNRGEVKAVAAIGHPLLT
jgi:hypothetical protein